MVRGGQRLALYEPAYYRIRVQGTVDESYSQILGHMAIQVGRDAAQHPVTTLSGQVRDQSALLGVLNYLLDRGFSLLLVEHVPEDI